MTAYARVCMMSMMVIEICGSDDNRDDSDDDCGDYCGDGSDHDEYDVLHHL